MTKVLHIVILARCFFIFSMISTKFWFPILLDDTHSL